MLVVDGPAPQARQGRCGVCGRRCPGYDGGRVGAGGGRWIWARWAVVEAESPRVRCPDHGVVVGAVPWARHGAGHTRYFDDTVAWLAVASSKTAVTQLMRIGWRTVGRDREAGLRRCRGSHRSVRGLRRIGIDEISYRKGHKYLTVVVDHDTGGWCGPRPAATGPP